jgi:hypothetical protein
MTEHDWLTRCRRSGQRGGKASLRTMTRQQRQQRARFAIAALWTGHQPATAEAAWKIFLRQHGFPRDFR